MKPSRFRMHIARQKWLSFDFDSFDFIRTCAPKMPEFEPVSIYPSFTTKKQKLFTLLLCATSAKSGEMAKISRVSLVRNSEAILVSRLL